MSQREVVVRKSTVKAVKDDKIHIFVFGGYGMNCVMAFKDTPEDVLSAVEACLSRGKPQVRFQKAGYRVGPESLVLFENGSTPEAIVELIKAELHGLSNYQVV